MTLISEYLDTFSVVLFAPHVLEDWIHGSSVVEFLLKLMGIAWRMRKTTYKQRYSFITKVVFVSLLLAPLLRAQTRLHSFT